MTRIYKKEKIKLRNIILIRFYKLFQTIYLKKIGECMKKLKKAILVYNPKSGNANMILSNFDLITTKLLEKGIALTLYSINKDYDLFTEILKNEKYDCLRMLEDYLLKFPTIQTRH